MNISFKSRKLEKTMSSPREIAKSYGSMAKRVSLRLSDLKAAASLAVLRKVPQANCHELKGDRKGQLAVDVSSNCRLILVPHHHPLPLLADGGLDWNQITDIMILSIEDYH